MNYRTIVPFLTAFMIRKNPLLAGFFFRRDGVPEDDLQRYVEWCSPHRYIKFS